LAALTKLVADFPAIPVYRQDLARTYFNLGTLLQEAKPGGAEKAYRRALELREKLVSDSPGHIPYQSDLALVENNLGVVLRGRGGVAEALRLARAAVGHERRAIQGNPRPPRYPLFLAEHYQVLAETLLPQGEHAEAAQAAAELARVAPADG